MATQSSTKYFSSKQEKMVADALGSYPVGGSGAFAGSPGDVRTYDWLVECKTHTTPGHNILFNYKVWAKIQSEAMGTHRKPVLIVDDGSQSLSRNWCLCRRINLNLEKLTPVDFPATIKPNLSCSHEKLKSSLTKDTDFYLVKWHDCDVAILPLTLFKELFEE